MMNTTKLTILIIDDSPDDLEFYTHLLKRADGKYSYQIFTAENAEEGLEAFKMQDIDCVFIDFNMPEDDGLAVVDMLQHENDNKQIPMVILTGEPHQRIKAESARQGAMDYIAKDGVTSPEALENVIHKVMARADAMNKGESLHHG